MAASVSIVDFVTRLRERDRQAAIKHAQHHDEPRPAIPATILLG